MNEIETLDLGMLRACVGDLDYKLDIARRSPFDGVSLSDECLTWLRQTYLPRTQFTSLAQDTLQASDIQMVILACPLPSVDNRSMSSRLRIAFMYNYWGTEIAEGLLGFRVNDVAALAGLYACRDRYTERGFSKDRAPASIRLHPKQITQLDTHLLLHERIRGAEKRLNIKPVEDR